MADEDDTWFEDVAAEARKQTGDPEVHAWVDDVVAEAKQQSRQEKAAETKRRRNRMKLIHAADDVMHEQGMSATVESIAKAAGLSTATFYTFYTSRNALCVDAFLELVVDVLDDTLTDNNTVQDRIEATARLCFQRRSLLRAALIERLESPIKYPVTDDGFELTGLIVRAPLVKPYKDKIRVQVREVRDFVDCIACLLWQPIELKGGGSGRMSTITIEASLHMAALELLDGVASDRRVIYPEGMVSTVDTVSSTFDARLMSSEVFIKRLLSGIYSHRDEYLEG